MTLAGAVTLVPWVGSYALMFALQLATALGSAAFHPAGTGAAAEVSRSRTGVMIGIFLAGGYLGYACSQLIFSAIYLRTPRLTPVIMVIPLAVGSGARHAASGRLERPVGRPAAPDAPCSRGSPGWCRCSRSSSSPPRPASRWSSSSRTSCRRARRRTGSSTAARTSAWSRAPASPSCRPATSPTGGAPAACWWSATRPPGCCSPCCSAGPCHPLADLALVTAFGLFNGVNTVVTVAEGNRMLPGQASGVSSLLMGLPWCVAALGPVVAGVLAEPAHGGSPVIALSWLGPGDPPRPRRQRARPSPPGVTPPADPGPGRMLLC